MANDFLDRQDSRGRTALHQAVINRQPAIVQQLLTQGADPNIADHQGRRGFTPMWYACCQTADPLSVMALKQAGAKVDLQMFLEIQRQLQAEPHNQEKLAIRNILVAK